MSGSVALVVLDSMRKDYFDEYFDWLPGIWFEHAWSTANNSVPAHGSLFGGKYPSELGVHPKSQRLDCPEPVLAEQLRDAGYHTRAYSANELIGPDHGFDRGFEEFNLRWDLSATYPQLFPWRSELTGSDSPRDYLRAGVKCILDPQSNTVASLKRAYDIYSYEDEGAREALGFIPSIEYGSQEFLFLNLMEAHWPFWGPADFLSYDSDPVDGESETIPGGDVDLSPHQEGYEEWVSYLATQYRRLFDHLSRSFDYVITVGDHGELFGEHGAKAHFYGLFEELTRIPVVISDGRTGRERRSDVVSLVDVHATVCGIAGVENARRGTDLRMDKQTEPRLLEFHGFDANRWERLLDQGFTDEKIEQYDQYLAGIAMRESYYGHESLDGFIETGKAVGDPQDELERLLQNLNYRHTRDSTVEVSAETMKRLQHFGYR